MYSVRLDPSWPGWVYLFLDGGRGARKMACSNVCDTLGELIRALAPKDLNCGKVEIPATDENRHDYVLSVRLVGDDLEIVAKKRPVYPRRPNWTTLVRIRDQQSRVRATFARAFRELTEPLGPKGYQAWWGHPLPGEEFNRLLAGCRRAARRRGTGSITPQ